jgi:hypothetical protein
MAMPQTTRRFVGLDMDETLGYFSGLSQLDTTLKHLQAKDAMSADVIDQIVALYSLTLTDLELSGKTHMFRPDILLFVRELYDALNTGKIAGIFLLTNNPGFIMARIVVEMMNHMADPTGSARKLILPEHIFHANHERRPSYLVKSLYVIRNCLGDYTIAPSDILFIDDVVQDLATEGVHFLRVPRYSYTTPLHLFVSEFMDILELIAADEANGFDLNTIRHSNSCLLTSSLLIRQMAHQWVELEEYMTIPDAFAPSTAYVEHLRDCAVVDSMIPTLHTFMRR